MTIWIVEDDPLQAEGIEKVLRDAFPKAAITLIKTESGFRSSFQAIAKTADSVIILDVMLRWSDVDTRTPRPEDVRKGGVQRAGLRCQRMLASDSRTKHLPVILYTVLEQHVDLDDELADLPKNVRYLNKASDENQLVKLVRDLSSGRR